MITPSNPAGALAATSGDLKVARIFSPTASACFTTSRPTFPLAPVIRIIAVALQGTTVLSLVLQLPAFFIRSTQFIRHRRSLFQTMRASFPSPAFQVLCEKISVSRLPPGASPPVRDRRPVHVARKDRTLGDESRVPPVARVVW